MYGKLPATALICLTVMLYSFATYPQSQPALPSQERLQFRVELDNVRALPFSYTAVCEAGKLKIRAATSATFVISDSLLCELASASISQSQRAAFALCSNDPVYRHEHEPPPIPRCFDLQIERTEL